MKTPLPFNNYFDALMEQAMQLPQGERMKLIHRMEQRVNLDETLPTRLTDNLDDKVKTLTLSVVSKGGAL